MSSAFLLGFRDCLAVQLAVGPFALVSGAVAAEAGLSLLETMGWSLAILAGASQMAALGMLSEGAPVVIAVLTGVAINLRFAMYSASLAPHLLDTPLGHRVASGMMLTDQAYALAIRRYAEVEEAPARRMAYYTGAAAMTAAVWHACTLAGFVVGARIPAGLSLDFMIPLCFAAVFAPLLRDRPSILAAVVAVAVSLALHRLPFNFGVLAGGFAGIAAGYAAETRARARAA